MRDTTLEILYEDNHIIAVNKHGSDLSQGDKTGDESIDDKIKEYLRVKHNKPGEAFLGVVHRLDRPVSGVVLYGKTTKALSRLGEMFRNKDVKKTYWAIVKELPPAEEGELHHFLKKNEVQNKSYAFPKLVKGSKEASLNYKLVARSDNHYLLEIDLHTGRHHQIRCQLAAIGCPIRGDLKYGFNRSNENGSIDLHARKIEFIHPVSKEPVSIIAPVPKGSFTLMFGNLSKEGVKVREPRMYGGAPLSGNQSKEGAKVREPRKSGRAPLSGNQSKEGVKVREPRKSGRVPLSGNQSKEGAKVREPRKSGRVPLSGNQSKEGTKVREPRKSGRAPLSGNRSKEGAKVREPRKSGRAPLSGNRSKEGVKVKEPRQSGRAPRKK
jgi:23S rRNA pseudouridine1911/1915/1917 synthase